MASKLLAFGAAAVALAAAACSYSYTFSYQVTLEDGVDVPDGAQILLSSSEGVDDIADARDSNIIDTDGSREYSGSSNVGTAPEMTINFFAWVDLDDDGEWDDGEPWGEDPNNPVKIDDDGYRSVITIGPDAE